MRTLSTPTLVFLILSVILINYVPAAAQGPANVLLVINEVSPASVEIGNYYAEKRGIPRENVLRLRLNATESIERADYDRLIELPIANWLTRNFAQDRILYIVLTKGIPLRVAGTGGQEGTVASVDSELAVLYRKLAGQPMPLTGRINNPYFQGDSSGAPKRFTHENFDIFLVTRLDGYTVADVRSLIDRALNPAKQGSIVLDDKAASEANPWLKSAADLLKASLGNNRVVYDVTGAVMKDIKGVLGYYSWGSNDPAIRDRHLNLGFVNGALGGMFVSTDARTFNEPPSDWKISGEDATTEFAGSHQSLTGDLIRDGLTGTAGHVAEPFLDATLRPNILFPAYVGGANLAEAFYLAMPYLSWQTVVIGDPLCAPFQSTKLTSDQIDKGIDPSTEYPVLFSAYRLKNLTSPAVNPDGVDVDTIKMLMRADARGAKQDMAGVRQLLEQATARHNRLGGASLTLGLLYEQSGEFDKAIERYRRVLDIQPNNLLALNNLAYSLATRRNAAQEALPLAEKAYALANKNPSLIDTLAWVVHLTGDNRRAKALYADALQAGPQIATIHFHAAVVHADSGDKEAAEKELARTLELNPRLAGDEEVQQLRKRLQPNNP
jgi:uncharacterized protein (TIGR03790 family)